MLQRRDRKQEASQLERGEGQYTSNGPRRKGSHLGGLPHILAKKKEKEGWRKVTGGERKVRTQEKIFHIQGILLLALDKINATRAKKKPAKGGKIFPDEDFKRFVS